MRCQKSKHDLGGTLTEDVNCFFDNDLRRCDDLEGANSKAFRTGSSEGIEDAKSLAGRLASLNDAEKTI